jgi:mxaA protein
MKNRLVKWMLASILLIGASTTLAQEVDARVVSISNPMRSNGIQIGEVMDRKVVIETSQPYQLSKDSLPMKGVSREGVELTDINVKTSQQGKKTIHEIAFRYQVFMSASSPIVMQLPEEDFALSGGPKALSFKLPPWRFWFSPLVVADITTAKANLQPQYKPSLIDSSLHRSLLMVFIGLFGAGLLGLVYINADRRWLPFMGGPFAQAHRSIKRLPRSTGHEKKVLFHLHHAFNKVHGTNLFAPDVAKFIEAHPEFAKVRTRIEAFFDESNKMLFGQSGNDATQFFEELTLFSKSMRDCERGLA